MSPLPGVSGCGKREGRRAQHEQVGRGCRAGWYSHYWPVERASLGSPWARPLAAFTPSGCLLTRKAASLGAEGVNLGTGVCKGLQNRRQRLLTAPENTWGRVVSLDQRWEVSMGSESASCGPGLMLDAGHSPRSLLTGLCLAEHHQCHREPQKVTATRARAQRCPRVWVSPCQASEEPGLSTSEFKSHSSSHNVVLAHGGAISHVRPLEPDSNPVAPGFELQTVYYTRAKAKGQVAALKSGRGKGLIGQL